MCYTKQEKCALRQKKGETMITLLSADKKQFKANLHCHSTLSDGRLTPAELKEAYRAHGYQVLAITDHEQARDHSDLTDENFLMLTGYEVYFRPDRFCRSDMYGPEIHFNLFARDPHNVGMICFCPDCCKYLNEEEKAAMVKVGDCPMPRQYTVGYVNRAVRTARENGYIAAYNHPVWSLEDYDTIFGYQGFFSMEMCNYSSFVGNRLEYNGALYDAMLRRGMRIAVHSADDNHNAAPFDSPKNDSFGGFAYILADKLTYDDVFTALENQNFYSSMGPQIYSLTVDGGVVSVRTSPVDQIILYDGGKSPKSVFAEPGQKVTEAFFEIRERAPYIRVSALDDGWKFADTRGYFYDEFKAAMPQK